MKYFKYISLTILASLPALFFAQDGDTKAPVSHAMDCPAWGTVHKASNRTDFLEYMRKSQGKKVSANDPYYVYARQFNPASQRADSLAKPATENDFYTRKRYNITPSSKTGHEKPDAKEKNSVMYPAPGGASEKAAAADKAEPIVIDKPQQYENAQLKAINADPSSVQQKSENTVAPAPTVEQKEASPKETETGNSKVESGKAHTSWFKRKLTRLFAKKTNKPAKPHYEKCTTRF